MTRRISMAILLVAALGGGCAFQRSSDGAPPPPTSSNASGATFQGANGGNPSQGPLTDPNASRRSRIVTVTLDMTTRDVNGVARSIREQVERVGGYVVSAESMSGENRFAMMQVRIPGNALAAFRRATGRLARIEHESETTTDVTEQRVDLAARLRNARAQEERVMHLMQEYTGTLPEVIAAENELARVREIVERLDAQLTGMDAQIDFATVDVRVGLPGTTFTESPGDSLSSAASGGLRAGWAFLLGAFMFVLAVGPTLLIIAVPTFFVVRTLVRRRRRRASQSPLPPTAPTLA